MPVTRRSFLQLAAGLPVLAPIALTSVRAQQGLEQFAISAPPCQDASATPAVKAAAKAIGAFRPGAPARTVLVEADTPGRRLTLTGTVAGLTCGRIKGARVDFWQADSRGVLDPSGFRLRGHQLTDAEGRYRLVTIVPGATGAGAPNIGIRVDVPGKLTFETAAFLPDDPRNAKDARFRPALVMRSVVSSGGDGRAAIFDIALDL